MKQTLQSFWQTVSHPETNLLPLLSGLEISKLTWAKRLETYQEIPQAYRAFFSTILRDGEIFPYTVITPSYEGFLNPTIEKLVCLLDDRIYIVQRRRNQLNCTGYPFCDINYIEQGTDLLTSWIKVSGRSDQSGHTFSTLRFNSVTDYLFSPILDRIRPAPAPDSTEPRAEFEELAQTHFKFMNFARRSVRPGDQVIQTVIQPALRMQRFKRLPWSPWRELSPAFMAILTDQELIQVREYEHHRKGKGTGYGHVWTYIPRDKIERALATPGSLPGLTIQLPGDESLEWLFPKAETDEVIAFAEAIGNRQHMSLKEN